MSSNGRQISSNRSVPRIAVIGGGIAGLSAALTLHEAGAAVTLIEASERLGGKIRTEQIGEFTVEAGPDSMLSYKPAGLALIERLGLLDRVINTSEDGEGTYILHRGKLQPLPGGMSGLVPVDIRSIIGTRLLSLPGKLRLGLEYFLTARDDPADESIGAFVRRRFGNEFYRNLAEPLLSGIYAGDADQLSLQAAFPRLQQSEQLYGGLIRSELARRRSASAHSLADKKWTPFITLRQGLGEIVDRLTDALVGADIRTGVPTTSLHHIDAGYRVDLASGECLDVEGVVLATPAWSTADLLRWMAPQIARELDAIPYVSTATISLAYDREAAGQLELGCGFLIPRAERRTSTAVTVSSSKFTGRAPDGCILLRGYTGRANDMQSLDLDDDDLIATVRRELAETAGLRAEPRVARVYRWPRALPQYNLGHPERIRRIEALATEYPGLALTGAAYRGVGIPDCIQDGILQAGNLLEWLESSRLSATRRTIE